MIRLLKILRRLFHKEQPKKDETDEFIEQMCRRMNGPILKSRFRKCSPIY